MNPTNDDHGCPRSGFSDLGYHESLVVSRCPNPISLISGLATIRPELTKRGYEAHRAVVANCEDTVYIYLPFNSFRPNCMAGAISHPPLYRSR